MSAYPSITQAFQDAEKRFTDAESQITGFLKDFQDKARAQLGGGSDVWLTPMNQANIKSDFPAEELLNFDGRNWYFNLSIAVTGTAIVSGLIAVPLRAEVQNGTMGMNMIKRDGLHRMPGEVNFLLTNIANAIVQKLRGLTIPPNHGEPIIIQ